MQQQGRGEVNGEHPLPVSSTQIPNTTHYVLSRIIHQNLRPTDVVLREIAIY